MHESQSGCHANPFGTLTAMGAGPAPRQRLVSVPSPPPARRAGGCQIVHGHLETFVSARQLGTVLCAPLRVRLWPGKFREPDVVFMLARHGARMGERYWKVPILSRRCSAAMRKTAAGTWS